MASEAAFCESTFSICNRQNCEPEALQRFGVVCRNKASQRFRWALRAAPLYRPSRVLVCKGSTFPLEDGAFPKTAQSPDARNNSLTEEPNVDFLGHFFSSENSRSGKNVCGPLNCASRPLLI